MANLKRVYQSSGKIALSWLWYSLLHSSHLLTSRYLDMAKGCQPQNNIPLPYSSSICHSKVELILGHIWQLSLICTLRDIQTNAIHNLFRFCFPSISCIQRGLLGSIKIPTETRSLQIISLLYNIKSAFRTLDPLITHRALQTKFWPFIWHLYFSNYSVSIFPWQVGTFMSPLKFILGVASTNNLHISIYLVILHQHVF